ARVNAWLEFGNIGLDVTVVRGDVREIPKLVGEHDIATLFGNSMVHFDPFDAVRIFSGVASVLSGGGVFIIEDRDRVQQLLQSKGGRELFLIRSEENHALASIQEGYEVRRGTLRVSYYLIPGFKKVGSFDYHHWDLATQLAIGGIFFQESRLLTRGEHGRGIGDVLLFKNPRKGIADRIFEDYNV
ncbi:MAG: hypothetical protein PWQ79_2345, partial [Thermococcaceae archaeon]|nr:hypothetical protein [Thermococcaceae archaeon]